MLAIVLLAGSVAIASLPYRRLSAPSRKREALAGMFELFRVIAALYALLRVAEARDEPGEGEEPAAAAGPHAGRRPQFLP